MAPTPVEYDARNTNASSSSLAQRVPLQPWETMRDKGARQSCYFSMAIKDMDNAQEWLPEPNFGTPRKSQSEFTSYSELGANGWRVKVSTVDDMFDEETISLHTKTFSALDISADLSTWRTVDITHLDTKVIKGKVFPSTGALLFMFVNCVDGVIIIDTAYSPRFRRPNGQTIPPLCQISDVLFLVYQYLCPDIPLRVLIQHGIANPHTLSAIDTLFQKLEVVVPGEGMKFEWPGVEVLHSDQGDRLEGYQALLGNPNGMMGCWYVNQHKDALGLRRISRINVVYVSDGIGNDFKDIVYRIDDVPSSSKQFQCSAETSAKPADAGHLLAAKLSPVDFSNVAERGKDLAGLFGKSNDELNKACKWPKDPVFQESADVQSPFAAPSDLQKNGWNVRVASGDQQFWSLVNSYLPMLEDLGLKTRNATPPWEGTILKQDAAAELKSKDGKKKVTLLATGASWRATHNVEAGVLIISDFTGIKEITDGRRSDTKMVPLREKFDLAFLEWERACELREKDPRNISYIFDVGIKTDLTKNVIQRCWDTSCGGASLPQWPGCGFWPKDKALSECFHAVLGTQEGLDASLFLLRHQDQLGPKKIWSITIFWDTTAEMGTWSILFLLKNV